MKQFRVLRPDEIECRVSTCTEKGVTVLLYKTARTDADLLDETVGADRWANDFKTIDGVLYGGIGVDYAGNGNFIWKWDAGSEGNIEVEKSRASDSFKRSGSKHGIGRELYSAPFIFIPAGNCTVKRSEKTGKYQCYDNFEVESIYYDTNEHISALTITLKGQVVWQTGKRIEPPKKEIMDDELCLCEKCNTRFIPFDKNGEKMKPDDYVNLSRKYYGAVICQNCRKR